MQVETMITMDEPALSNHGLGSVDLSRISWSALSSFSQVNLPPKIACDTWPTMNVLLSAGEAKSLKKRASDTARHQPGGG